MRSALDKNLKARNNSKTPRATFKSFIQTPERGKRVITDGKTAKRVKGTARPSPKPLKTIRISNPTDSELEARRLPRAVPSIGPVHEKETSTRVNAIKTIAIRPLDWFAF